MLRNRLYLGEINHRDQSYPGEHRPIIDSALFDEVQAKLDENLRTRRLKNEPSQALLLGKLYDDRGNRMTPSYAIKKGVRYRYYVSCGHCHGNLFLLTITHPPTEATTCDSNSLALRSRRLERPLLAFRDNACVTENAGPNIRRRGAWAGG